MKSDRYGSSDPRCLDHLHNRHFGDALENIVGLTFVRGREVEARLLSIPCLDHYGMSSKNRISAWIPPADAPMPTIGKSSVEAGAPRPDRPQARLSLPFNGRRNERVMIQTTPKPDRTKASALFCGGAQTFREELHESGEYERAHFLPIKRTSPSAGTSPRRPGDR